MSSCELRLEFDRADRTYRVGDDVRGTVVVELNRRYEADALRVTLEWETHGRGNRDSGVAMTTTLSSGGWPEGGVHRYPFHVTIPNGPVTFHGHNLYVDWYVRAKIVRSLARDVRAEEQVLVGFPESSSEGMARAYNIGAAYRAHADLAVTTRPGGHTLVGGIALLGLGFGGFLMLRRLLVGPESEGVFTLFAILFFFVGIQVLALGLIGEYIGRIYLEVRKRPRYVIQRVHETEAAPADRP